MTSHALERIDEISRSLVSATDASPAFGVLRGYSDGDSGFLPAYTDWLRHTLGYVAATGPYLEAFARTLSQHPDHVLQSFLPSAEEHAKEEAEENTGILYDALGLEIDVFDAVIAPIPGILTYRDAFHRMSRDPEYAMGCIGIARPLETLADVRSRDLYDAAGEHEQSRENRRFLGKHLEEGDHMEKTERLIIDTPDDYDSVMVDGAIHSMLLYNAILSELDRARISRLQI